MKATPLMMKPHVTIAVAAAMGAIAVSFWLGTFGAEGMSGFFAVWLGFAGGLASWKLAPNGVNYWLTTASNWLVYVLLLEALLATKRHISN